MTLKITSGKFRGHKLSAPNNIRPATSFVKEAIFNICRCRIENANFLDLFAGSGAIGLEAVSRGAKFATFVDKSPLSVKTIKKNVNKLNVQNFTKIVCIDAIEFIKNTNAIFDIVCADPPFIIYEKNPSYINELLLLLTKNIDKNSIIFLEEPTYSRRNPNIENLLIQNKRKYGSAYLFEYILKTASI